MSPRRRMQELGEAIDPGGAPGITTTLIVLALIGCLTFLTWQGKVNGDAFVSLASVIIGGVLVRGGVSAGSKATSDPPPSD